MSEAEVFSAEQTYVRAQRMWKLFHERDDLKGRSGWEPPDPHNQAIRSLIHHGYVRRADGVFFFERMKDTHVVWTDCARRLFARELPDTTAGT